MTTDRTFTAIAAARATIDELVEEREQKVEARNARIARLYKAGLSGDTLADVGGITASYVRKLADTTRKERGSDRKELTDSDHVHLSWVRTVVASIESLDAAIAAERSKRNQVILAAAADGLPHQELAEAAGVGRSWVTRLVNES